MHKKLLNFFECIIVFKFFLHYESNINFGLIKHGLKYNRILLHSCPGKLSEKKRQHSFKNPQGHLLKRNLLHFFFKTFCVDVVNSY